MAEDESVLPPGKLPGELLGRLIGHYVKPDPSVLIGPGIGRDAAAIAVGDRVIVVKTDPITFATADIGRYLVNVNANDITCMGAAPRWLLVTALLPERSTTPALVESIFASLASAADELGILLVGGHSEITIGLDRPILVGQMIGEAEPGDLLNISAAQPGDAVVLCSAIAIEGTAILASEARDQLGGVEPGLLETATRLLHDPGISVVPAARALRAADVRLRGLHDPTEGGLITALHELAEGSALGIEIDAAAIPIRPECRAICEVLRLDPLGLIASGSLLAVLPNGEVERALEGLRAAGIDGARIGTLTSQPEERWLTRDGNREPLPTFPVDEIARFFASSGQNPAAE